MNDIANKKLKEFIRVTGKNHTAEHIGVSRHTLTNWLRGKDPNVSGLKKISKAFKLTWREILGKEPR